MFPCITVDQGIVGPRTAADGSQFMLRGSRDSSLISTDAHARYQEAVIRGNVFTLSSVTAGITVAAANNSPLAANTGQPLVGIFNPASNKFCASILRAFVSQISGTPAAVPMFFWNVIASPAGITAASANPPINNFTFKGVGSSMQGYINSALTGSVVAIVLRPIAGITIATPTALAQGTASVSILEETAGEIIVPPGGFCGIAVGNGAGTTWLVSASMTWEEVIP